MKPGGIVRQIAIVIACLWAAALQAAPKTVAYLRLSQAAPIYHGADANSKVEAQGMKGDVYALVDTSLIHGFYKIDNGGHVSYIDAGAVILLSASGSPVPTPAPTLVPTETDDSEDDATPTVAPTPKATAVPTEGDDDEEEDTTPTVVPTPKKTAVPTLKATAAPTEEEEEEEATPTPVPTRKATAIPTAEPTEEATEAPTVAPTSKPTIAPTKVPTPAPTEEATEAPTPLPTKQPTARPTAVPTLIPTAIPTAAPTARPTAIPTAVPTARPTPVPTARPTPVPTAVPGIVTPPHAHGRRLQPAQVVQAPPRGGGRAGISSRSYSIGGNFASSFNLQREPGHLDHFELYIPVGMGKHETLVQPPFKQDPGMNDQRPVEFSGFVGLGAELRLAPPLRLGFDWIAHSHRTKAADLGIPAPKVGVPGSPSTTQFDESDAWYRMNSHQFRLNLKASLPFSVVEPWVSASYGMWVWSAELTDLNRTISYGEDAGTEFGGTVGTGIDLHGSFAGGLGWTITPFVEWGAPQVNPTFTNVAGLGVDWKDTFGTPVAVPARMGLQFGLGF
jgi:hypothetical protein